MPNVGGVQYPYTREGMAAAQQAQRPIQKTGPVFDAAFGPLTSPGLLEMVRRQPTFQSHRPEQPTFRDVSHRPQSGQDWLREALGSASGIADQYQPTGILGLLGQRLGRPETGIRQNWQTDAFGNVIPDQFGMPAIQQPNLGGFGQLAAGALRPSQPVNLGQLIGQLVRGLPQTPTPGLDPSRGAPRPQPTFGSISHRPPDVGGRSIQKMGPTIPASTNYRAISPANRIAGNISAVMSGRPGPSPGTTPYLNESGRLSSPPGYTPNPYGPTGQLRPPRQPVQKGG